jgi:hypothetical protein
VLVFTGSLAGLPLSAQASSTYPAEIRKQLSLSYPPACAICHENGVTGFGTVTTPFGEAMRAQGLVCCDIASLDKALAALEADMSPYITDLKEGRDPNDPNEFAGAPLTYGCFNVTGRGPLAGGFILGLALLLATRACRGRR